MTGRRRIIVAAVAAGLVCLMFFLLFVRARQSELGEVREQVAAEEDQTVQLRTRLAQLEELQRNAPRLNAQLTELRRLVPEDNEVANFIFLVQEAANAAGVGFVQITPELPDPPATGAQVAEVRMQIGARGGYFSVQDFFRRLYDLDRAVRIDNFTMAGGEGEDVELEGRIDLDATARIFFELPAATAATATAGTTPTTTPAPGTSPAAATAP